MINSGNNSGSYYDGKIELGVDRIVSSGDINKSPVLYLRRRRNTDFNRFRSSSYTSDSNDDKIILKWSEEGFEPADKGTTYPNHESSARIGNVEWTMFREYKRRRSKWLKEIELVIDGTTIPDIT